MAISDDEKKADSAMSTAIAAAPTTVTVMSSVGTGPSDCARTDVKMGDPSDDKPIYHPRLARPGIKRCPPFRVESPPAKGLGRERPNGTNVSEDAPEITLYRLQACPFCERVVRKLREYDLDYRSRFVEPMHSDRNVVRRISGKRTVPAIVDETTGVTMSESANIVEYLDATYGGGSADAGAGGAA
jgi:glutaredoxin